MSRYNNGIIITNNNCIGCNYCISQCSILGANVCVKEDGKKIIAVDSNKCNHCGKCIAMCIHNARDYIDDTNEFLQDLLNGEKISVILDPSFYYTYGDNAFKICGYLKSLGVDKFYNGSYGAEISIWATIKYLKDHQNDPLDQRAFIANTCPAFINVVEMKYPNLLNKVIPVQSSAVCTAIYANKYKGDTNKIAYIGPCIAKKDEISNKNTYDYISYNITMKHLWEKISSVDFSNYDIVHSEVNPITFGLFSIRTSFYKNIISNYFSKSELTMVHTGLGDLTFNKLMLYSESDYNNLQPLLAEIYACPNGCFEGPGIDTTCYNKGENFSHFNNDYKKFCDSYYDKKDYDVLTSELYEHFKDLNFEDFIRTFTERYKQPFHISDTIYNDIFNGMLKTTEEKRHIDCGTCGYKTCKNMATAIAYSYTKKENCIHYMNEEMRNRLYFDSNANCPNKDAFIENVINLKNQNPEKNYRIYCGDINKYKVINELYGSAIGDEVLKIISKKLSELTDDDGCYGRITSGIFAMCLEENIDNLQKVINVKSFDCSELGINYPITMRFGFYTMTSEDEIDNNSIMYMINCAILAMDQKITQQENTYCQFSQELRNKQHEEARLSTLMKPALDNNEFVLYFQPQFSTVTNKLVGAETLCRWINKDGEMISPAVFIPVTEKNGFIRYLDKEIWRKAFSMVRSWIDQGYDPVPISLNISRVNLESEAIFYTIKHLKDEYKIPPELIHFEITESAYMGDQNNLLERINLIRSLGFQIAMDDFGSGYSSLNSLKDIPIDIIKLDMGFLKDSKEINENKKDKSSLDVRGGTIISSVMRMAQKLNYTTIAEGVENKEQAAFLKSIGCDIIQGFLYAKPMPENAFLEMLKEKNKQIDIIKTKPHGTIDIGKLINPTTQESIFFDNYIGSACIVEYNFTMKKASILKLNSKLKELLGVSQSNFDEINRKFSIFLDNATGNALLDALYQAKEHLDEVTCITENTNIEYNKKLWIKSHIWQINTNNESCVFLILCDDYSYIKELEQKIEE